MATQVQFRGGTTSEHSTFTGVAREVTVDTTKKTVVVHDGSTAGGIPLAKESAVTSAAAITGGSINGTTVGASTASTGAFTTLSASSTVSGAGFSTYLASPPAIGGTTASTGRFTTVTATGLTSGRVTYAGASGLLSDSSKLTFDTSNLTVGVIGLSANADGVTGKLVLRKPNEASGNGQITRMLDFAPYYPGFDEAVVKASIFSGVDTGTQNGQIGFMTATGGVLSEKMRLLANGNLGIGTSSPNAKLQITSSAFPVLKVADAIGGGALALGDEGTNNNYVGIWRGAANSISGGGFLNVQGNGIAFMSTDNVFGSATRTMTLDNGGNLLLGTTASNYRLNVKGAGTVGDSSVYAQFTTLDTGTTATDGLLIGLGVGSSPAAYVGQYENAPLIFLTNGTEKVRIDSSGNLLVGKTVTTFTTDGVWLQPAGTAWMSRDSDVSLVLNRNGTDGQTAQFYKAGTQVGSISVTTTLTSYNVSSDYRLKENIAPMTGALKKVAQLNPVTYKWKIDGSDGQGFIAHELAEVVPDCVTGEKDAVDEDGKPQYQAMDTSHLVATLVSAIQEQQALIQSLTTRLTALENK